MSYIPEIEVQATLGVTIRFRPEAGAWPDDVLADPDSLIANVVSMYRQDPAALLEHASPSTSISARVVD